MYCFTDLRDYNNLLCMDVRRTDVGWTDIGQTDRWIYIQKNLYNNHQLRQSVAT